MYKFKDCLKNNPYSKTTSGYFNTILYLLDNFREDFPEIFDTEATLSNGVPYSKCTVNFIHREQEFSKKAGLNISNTGFGVDSFIFPVKVKKYKWKQGNKILIPDFDKNPELALKIIESNKNLDFKLCTKGYPYTFHLAETLENETDLEKIIEDVEKAICVSNFKYETFGIFPLELIFAGVPCMVSSKYTIPFKSKVNIQEEELWINFKDNEENFYIDEVVSKYEEMYNLKIKQIKTLLNSII